MNQENEFMKALFNIVIPSALAGAVVQIATRMLKKDITFTGAVLTLIIAGGMSIPIGIYLYFETTPATCAALTSFSGMFSRDLARWIVYGSKIDKALDSVVGAVVQWIKNRLK